MAAPREFGFELCLKAQAEDIKTRSDVVLMLLHWRLLRHSFLCIGDFHYTHHIPSELIPLNLGWNASTNLYSLKFAYKQHMFLLNMSAIDENGIVQIKLYSETEIVTLNVDVQDACDESLIVNMQKCYTAAKQIDKELIEKILHVVDDVPGPVLSTDEEPEKEWESW